MTEKRPAKKAPAKRPAKRSVKKVAPQPAAPTPPTSALSWEQDIPVTYNESSRGAAPTEVTSTRGVLPKANLLNLDNWRALLHQVTPVIVGVLTALGVTTQNTAPLWMSLVFAIFDPLLSYTNTADKARRIIYGVLGLLQSGGLLAVILGDHQLWLPVATTAVTVISSTLARFYTPTSTVVPPTSPRSIANAAPR